MGGERNGGAALVPLLFEKGWEKDWDATVCVACAAQTQKTRLASRGLNEEEIRSRLASQWNQERKMKSADIVVMNDGGLETLREEAARVIKMILEKKNNE